MHTVNIAVFECDYCSGAVVCDHSIAWFHGQPAAISALPARALLATVSNELPQARLEKTGVKSPTAIQAAAIPVILRQTNAAIQGATGSGKVRCTASACEEFNWHSTFMDHTKLLLAFFSRSSLIVNDC